MLRVFQVYKAYGKRSIINGISFDVNEGDYIAIIGPAGSGKTTLLSMISGLIVPDAGDIIFENKAIPKLSYAMRNRIRGVYFGYIFQHVELIKGFTVWNNILSPIVFQRKPVEEDFHRARWLIEQLTIQHLVHKYPGELSGGESQLVSIVRSLIHKPKLLLADEPTGNLDKENQKRVRKLLLHENQKGIAIVLVTHDLQFAMDAKTIYTMQEGEFIRYDMGKRHRRKKSPLV